MTIQEIEQLYGRSPQANAFLSLLEEKSEIGRAHV